MQQGCTLESGLTQSSIIQCNNIHMAMIDPSQLGHNLGSPTVRYSTVVLRFACTPVYMSTWHQTHNLLRQVVRHSNAVLTYEATYWPKDGIPTGHIESSIKCYMNQRASRLTKLQHSQPTVFSFRRPLSMLATESQSNQAATFLAVEFDRSICEYSKYVSADLCNTLYVAAKNMPDTLFAW